MIWLVFKFSRIQLFKRSKFGNKTSFEIVWLDSCISRPYSHGKADRLTKDIYNGFEHVLLVTALHSFVDFHFYIVAILMVMGLMCARIQEITGLYYTGLMRSFIPAHKLSKKLFVLVAGIIPVIILNYIFSHMYFHRSRRLQWERLKKPKNLSI